MDTLDSFHQFLADHPRLMVLTGAGCSVASGIPTYRDGTGRWLRTDPIQHQDFLREPASRQRYWARSLAGWPAVAAAEPNIIHQGLAALEHRGRLTGLVTQNVDGLHQRAGHRNVIDLHGRLDRVVCLGCNAGLARDEMQERLLAINPRFAAFLAEDPDIRPDGDADVADALIADVRVPTCDHCDGVLKPDVVFFGGAVPKPRVAAAIAMLDAADALLVVGSSLKVFSGYRFCRHAARSHKPIATINPGVTRADDLLSLKVESPAERVFESLIA